MRGTIQPGILVIHGVGMFELVADMPRYVIARVPESIAIAGRVICCRTCRAVSCNPDDVTEKYCGQCQAFLDAPAFNPKRGTT